MRRFRSYWFYSTGLAIVWAVVLILVLTIRGRASAHAVLLVFLGYCLGWVSTTIARYVYPPPKRWGPNRRQEERPE
jgi:hypothetical protein